MNIFNSLKKSFPYDFKLCILDIGARDNLQWPWSDVDINLLDVHLFEPENDELAKLKKTSPKSFTIHNQLLSDKIKKTSLNINQSLGTSSIYSPNYKFLKNFTDYERFNLINKTEYDSTTLDKMHDDNLIPVVDFAKIDTQGSELKILNGGVSFLKNLLAIEIEVNFADLYLNQCTFSDVDLFIRNNFNLTLWDLKTIDWKYAKGANNSFNKKGQLIFGDALYLRSIEQLSNLIESLSNENKKITIIKLILISLIYGFVDYSIALLKTDDFRDILNKNDIIYFENLIKKVNQFSLSSKKGNKILYYIFHILSEIFKQSYNNSNRSKRSLGSQKIGNFWL